MNEFGLLEIVDVNDHVLVEFVPGYTLGVFNSQDYSTSVNFKQQIIGSIDSDAGNSGNIDGNIDNEQASTGHWSVWYPHTNKDGKEFTKFDEDVVEEVDTELVFTYADETNPNKHYIQMLSIPAISGSDVYMDGLDNKYGKFWGIKQKNNGLTFYFRYDTDDQYVPQIDFQEQARYIAKANTITEAKYLTFSAKLV